MSFAILLAAGFVSSAARAQSVLTADPSALTFTYWGGAPVPAPQTFQVTSSPSSGVSVTATTSGPLVEGPTAPPAWISVSPAGGTTPANFTVSVDPTGLSSGYYLAYVLVSDAQGSMATVSVDLAILPLVPTPASLSFKYVMGGTVPSPQTVNVTASGTYGFWIDTVTTDSGGNWLITAPDPFTMLATPGSVEVSIDPKVLAGLSPGTYQGQFEIDAIEQPQSIPVTLTVLPALAAAPTTLSFNYTSGGSLPKDQTISVTASGGAAAPITASTSGGSWLSVSPASGTTPATLAVKANPTGLGPGSYSGTVTVALTADGSVSQTVAVTLNITAPLVASPGALSFTYAVGASAPAAQTVSVASASGAMPFTAAASGGTWLSVAPTRGTTPVGLAVTVAPAGLAPGTYNGTITITSPYAANGPQTIAVSLVISPLAVSPSVLTFSFAHGGAEPPPQQISATTGGVPVSFSATASVPWIVVTPKSGTTPATLSISVDGDLQPGTYNGLVTVVPGGVQTAAKTISVSFSVSNPLRIDPSSLAFRYTAGGSLPAAQTISASTALGPVSISASASTSSGGNWLAVSQSGSSVTVSVNPEALAAGNYYGTINISSQSGSASVPVALIISAPLSVAPGSLSFTTVAGIESSASQSVSVTSGGVPAPFFVQISTSKGGDWLAATPSSATTASSIAVSVKATGLAPGTYTGSLVLSSPYGVNAKVVNVTLTVVAPGDLILTPGNLEFTGDPDGPNPLVRTISVTSSSHAPVPFSLVPEVTEAPAPDAFAKAITVTPSAGVTPALVTVVIRPTGLPVGLHKAQIHFTALNKPYSVGANLTVASAAPVLSVTPPLLEMRALAGSPAVGQFISVQNAGGGPPQSFSASVTSGAWLSLSGASGVLEPKKYVPVQVTADPRGLQPGPYLGIIRVQMGGQVQEVPVSFLVLTTDPYIATSFNGLQFEARAGEGLSLTREVSVFNLGGGTLNWTASLLESPGWLSLETKAGAFVLTPHPEGLAPGAYYASVQISDPKAANSPQLFTVVLNVVPADTKPMPVLSPAGALFVAGAGRPAPAPQTAQIFASTATPVRFLASAHTSDGAGWLSVTPAQGEVSTKTPVTLTISADPTGLQPGVYQGGVSVSLTAGVVRTINVVMIVLPAGTSAKSGGEHLAEGCTPSSLVPVYTGLVNNFATPAGWPVPVTVRVADDCGNPVPAASVVLGVSQGEPRFVALTQIDKDAAVYSATWTPNGAGTEVNVTAQAVAGQLSGTAAVVGDVADNKAPILPHNGLLNNFHAEVGGPLAPGGIIQIFGDNFTQATVTPDVLPLPTEVQGARVLIGGRAAPLYYVSKNQINAQIPAELVPRLGYPVLVSVNGALTVPDSVNLVPARPGVAAFPSGQVIAQHGDGSLVTADAPAAPGETVVIYLVGMGATTIAVPSGTSAPMAEPFARVSITPTVTLDGTPVDVAYAGLTPGAVGLYQINLTVPSTAASGSLALVVTQNDQQSNSSVLPVGAR